MLDAARNRVRVKACYVMIALTVLSCLLMVISGKEVITNATNEESWIVATLELRI